jgi:hypothetical protein
VIHQPYYSTDKFHYAATKFFQLVGQGVHKVLLPAPVAAEVVAP